MKEFKEECCNVHFYYENCGLKRHDIVIRVIIIFSLEKSSAEGRPHWKFELICTFF